MSFNTNNHVDDGNYEGLSSLVRLSGMSVPARARFVGETLLGSTLMGLSLGLLSGTVGATFFMTTIGPVVPFLIGSGVGYTYGLFYQWNLIKRRALTFCENYPRLMAHSLRWEWDEKDAPQHASNGKEFTAWVVQGGLSRVTLSILAAMSCAPGVEEIQQRNRQRIIDAYAEDDDDNV